MAKTKVEGFSSLRNAFGGVLSVFILLLIEVLPFSIHLFSVIKYESVIHEFDPYFNYKVTQFLSKNSIYEFWNWFDNRTWYPLGCVIGGTVYPGLALTTGTMWWTGRSERYMFLVGLHPKLIIGFDPRKTLLLQELTYIFNILVSHIEECHSGEKEDTNTYTMQQD